MKKIIFLSFLFVSIFLVSCVPERQLYFDVLNPADSPLPGNAKKALVFNPSYKPGADTSAFNILNKLGEKEQFIVDTLIVNSILNGFFFVADESPLPALNNSVYAEQRLTDTTDFLKPLSNESIRYLMNEFSVDLIISLEYFAMNYDYMKNYNFFDMAEAYLILDRIVIWRIYTKDGLQREKQDRDTLVWSGSGETYDDAENSLPTVLEAMKEAFWFAGESFAKEMSPSWKQTNRSYFQIWKDSYDKSQDPEYLLELSKSNKRIQAYKANFNLSVYYEKEGDPEKALNYMKAALRLRPEAGLAKYYKKQQQMMLKNAQKLEKQLAD